MLEKPDLKDQEIITCLQDEYGIFVGQVVFLPLGVDGNSAVYRFVTDDETPYFLKLRGGVFEETSVALPKFLSDQGIGQIIPPLVTRTGELWANLDAFKVILYPFIEGRNSYQVDLSNRHWVELGATLKSLHTVDLPPELAKTIKMETYSPQWRESLKRILGRLEDEAYDDPVSMKLTAFLKINRDKILDLVWRAEQLAQTLRTRSSEFILCHADIHAGNILIESDGDIYIVDWDDLIMAPKERDLMFIGGGLMGAWRGPQEEETLFYRGYGQTRIDPIALAYYRYERIIQDITIFCEWILLSNDKDEDREQYLRYLTSNFQPNNTIEIAYQADKTLLTKTVSLKRKG